MLLKTASAVIFLLAFLMSTRGDLVVKYLVEIDGERKSLVLKLKEGKARVDYTDCSLLISPTSNRFSYLSHSDKTYSEILGVEMLTRLQVMSILTGQVAGQTEATDFKPTGIMQKINGYETQEFAGNILGIRISIFLAKDSTLEEKLERAIGKSYSGPAFDALRELVGGLQNVSGLPVRWVLEGFGLKFAGTLESVQEADLDGFEFAIPPNYAQRSQFGS
jgi:hypothetical protein